MESATQGDSPWRGDFAAAQQYIPALVRQAVSSGRWTSSVGGGQVGALCRRFRGAGALSRDSSDGLDLIETRRLAGVGDQSGKDPGGASEGRRSETGLSGIHVPLPRGPVRARGAVFECNSAGESPEEETGEAARDDGPSPVLQADPATD